MLVWSTILIICFSGMDLLQVSEKEIVSLSVNETFVVPGKKNVALIRVKVKEGYHIQANKVNDESLIPVVLKITRNKPFSTGNPVFPPYKLFRLEGTEKFLNVFDSLFIIRLPIKTPVATKKGRHLIKAQLRYQACDAKTCLFPRNINLEIPIFVQ